MADIKPPFPLIGISTTTSNEDGRAAVDINHLWQRFYNENIIDKIPDKQGAEVYAVYHDYEGDHTKPYRVTIGCRVTDDTAPPDGLDKITIAPGPYERFVATGEQPQALIKTWTAIWEKKNLARAFKTDYEVYGPRFFEAGVHEITVFIGVKK